jgi:hypothetical protein
MPVKLVLGISPTSSENIVNRQRIRNRATTSGACPARSSVTRAARRLGSSSRGASYTWRSSARVPSSARAESGSRKRAWSGKGTKKSLTPAKFEYTSMQ